MKIGVVEELKLDTGFCCVMLESEQSDVLICPGEFWSILSKCELPVLERLYLVSKSGVGGHIGHSKKSKESQEKCSPKYDRVFQDATCSGDGSQ